MALSVFGLDPWQEMKRMERQMNRYFRDFPSTSSTPTEQGQVTQPELTTFWPRTDLRELDNEYQIHMELPGVKKEDVNIEMGTDGTLRVRGKKEQEKEERNERWHSVERNFGSFHRAFSVPTGVDPNTIQAYYDNGMLRLCIPKPHEQEIRKIELK